MATQGGHRSTRDEVVARAMTFVSMDHEPSRFACCGTHGRLAKLRLYVRGWMTYYGLSEPHSHWKDLSIRSCQRRFEKG